MRLYDVYQCDGCKKEAQTDGYPKDWLDVNINKNLISSGEDEEYLYEGDFCSLECMKQALLKYLGGIK